MSKKCALSVEGLTVNYGDVAALWDVNLNIFEGDIVGVIGPNGAGKSTLVKALLGFTHPVSGRVHFFDHLSIEECRKKIAYVPQTSLIDWDFPITCFELVLMGDYHERGWLKRPTTSGKKRALKLLEELRLGNFKDRAIQGLSGGQKQKLFVARALMQEADLYFFDEPFAGIDHRAELELIDLFKEMSLEGKTIVVVHHNLATAGAIFDHLVILNTVLVASGKTADVLTKENLQKAYGATEAILDQILHLSKTARDD